MRKSENRPQSSQEEFPGWCAPLYDRIEQAELFAGTARRFYRLG